MDKFVVGQDHKEAKYKMDRKQPTHGSDLSKIQ